MSPTSTNGKICYIELPATDIARSADFYSRVFGWKTRKRGDGATAFDDTTGQVSGTWIKGRPASTQPGLLVYIMYHFDRSIAVEMCSRPLSSHSGASRLLRIPS